MPTDQHTVIAAQTTDRFGRLNYDLAQPYTQTSQRTSGDARWRFVGGGNRQEG